MRIKKVCALCKQVFIAKKTTTVCCSDDCAKKWYKKKKRLESIQTATNATKEELKAMPVNKTDEAALPMGKVLINVITLSAATGFSRRTIFRLIAEDPTFPKIQTSPRNLKFNLEEVLQYFNRKYGNP